MAVPSYKILSCSGGPCYKSPGRQLKMNYCLQLQLCTLLGMGVMLSSRACMASACFYSSIDGEATKLSLQNWEMDILLYHQDCVQMNWGSPLDHRNKIYYLVLFFFFFRSTCSLSLSFPISFLLIFSRKLFACLFSVMLKSWISEAKIGRPYSECLLKLLTLFFDEMA